MKREEEKVYASTEEQNIARICDIYSFVYPLRVLCQHHSKHLFKSPRISTPNDCRSTHPSPESSCHDMKCRNCRRLITRYQRKRR